MNGRKAVATSANSYFRDGISLEDTITGGQWEWETPASKRKEG